MYKFGKINLNCKQIFFESHFSIGIVNLMPLLPGHVLLIPKRVIKRYHQMDEVEISDLFISVKKVGKVLESQFECNSLSICIQDGLNAGQSIEHVHVHLIPRRANDLQRNDDIYDMIEQFEFIGASENRQPRSMDEMEKEAQLLSMHFQ